MDSVSMLREWKCRMRKFAFAAFVLLQACEANHGVRPLRPQELAVSPYRDIVTSSLTGSLMYEGGCLLFRDDQTKARYLPVWPYGSVFNGTSVIFHQPAKADQRVIVGEEFVISGEASQWPQPPNPYYARFQSQCGAPPFFVSGVRPAS